MPKKRLTTTGGLNLDAGEAFLKDNEYVDAENLLPNLPTSFSGDPLKSGSAGSIKAMHGFLKFNTDWQNAATGSPNMTTMSVRGMAVDPDDDSLYVLFVSNSAWLVKFDTAGNETILIDDMQNASAASQRQSFFRLVGRMVVWRDALGTLYSWYVDRAKATNPAEEDLLLIRRMPGNLIVSNGTSTTTALGNKVLEENDFQFSCIWEYDSGEKTPLGPITKFAERRKAYEDIHVRHMTTEISLGSNPSYSFPTYLEKAILYVRRGNTGVWHKFGELTRSQMISGTNFHFSGELGEALDTRTAAQPYDAVPVTCKSMEIVDSRVMVGNFVDLYDDDIDISIDARRGYDIPAASTVQNFFAKRSSYAYGVLLFDKWGRTRGVEASVVFNTDLDKGEFPPVVEIDFPNLPSWVESYALAISDNLEFQSYFETFTSDVMYVGEAYNGDLEYYYDPTELQRPRVKYMAFDVSYAMEKMHIYSWKEGDYLIHEHISEPLPVLGVNGSFILTEPNFEYQRSDDSGQARIEIFSRKDDILDDNIIFYEYGRRMVAPSSAATRYLCAETQPVAAMTNPEFGSNWNLSVTNIEAQNYIYGHLFQMELFPVNDRLSYNGTTRINGSQQLATGLPTTLGIAIDVKSPTPFVSRSTLTWTLHQGKPFLEVPVPFNTDLNNTIAISGKYIAGINFNRINSFFATDRKELPYENGPITVMRISGKKSERGSVLLVFTSNEVSSVYISETELNQTSGDPLLSKTDLILGSINTLKGNYGGVDAFSVFDYDGKVWFISGERKKACRYSSNGIEVISDQGLEHYFRIQVPGTVWYDPLMDMAYYAGGGTPRTIAYSEKDQRWISRYDIAIPEDVIAYEGGLILAYRGVLYKNYVLNTFTLNTFFGPSSGDPFGTVDVHDTSVTWVLSDQAKPLLLETIAIHFVEGFLDSDKELITGIWTITITNENGQSTTLTEANFSLSEKVAFAHVLRDSGSVGGLVNGDYMIGAFNRIKIELTMQSPQTQQIIDYVEVGYRVTQGHLN